MKASIIIGFALCVSTSEAFITGVARQSCLTKDVTRGASVLKSTGSHFTSPLFSASAISSEDSESSSSSSETQVLTKWDPSNWTAPRFWNSLSFRSTTLLSVLALALYTGGGKLSSNAAASLHLLSFGIWFGAMFYTTFILGITAFKTLPKRQFGKLQSKLFPKYFNLCALALTVQLLTLKNMPALMTGKVYYALGSSMAMTLLNLFYLEPVSSSVMYNRYKLEDLPGGKESTKYKELKAKFGKFHGMSSLTNLIALCGAIAHGIYIASTLAV
mmetsp:Transcript_23450/g.36137  ORF Transcript_23450/g.36137 Transcript_23450/m.36137 type:complete len:273 (-) Transcript_23450:54-872(-)|eukprot:CAMPEP_0196811004 /NCGR_PEP_ID=MMETSP1362-20130617/16323_1 /TAXON_ID=163516 /ORGANISM="Leptocylindrus danicus, Strain CCMP1856" /LENGTH=272 /DNA_ID=CAMNT_0042186233 /DNA_START=73 /DNA_END=891 /DNA_ORIENTATION=+